MSHKELNDKEIKAFKHLRDNVIHRDVSPSVRNLAGALEYKSPRSALLVLNSLIEKGLVSRRADGTLQILKDFSNVASHARTVRIPLVGAAPCGAPLLAEQNIEALIAVSEALARPGNKYFLLRATGTSMNLAGINDGDIVLVRQTSMAENGDRVVALIDDEATIKIFQREKDVVILKPKSSVKKHQPIVLTEDFKIQGVVVATLPNLK